MRFSLRLAGLVLGALFALGGSARADFVMTFFANGTGNNFKVTQDTSGKTSISSQSGVTGLSTSGSSLGTIHVTGSINGYSFDLTGTSNRTTSGAKQAEVIFDGTVSTGASAPEKSGTGKTFGYTLGDTGFTFPGTDKSTVYLTANVETKSFDGGKFAQVNASYTDKGGTTTANSTDTLESANSSSTSAAKSIVRNGSTFDLSNIEGSIRVANQAKVNTQVISTAVVALPEPGAVLIGLVGVPCMGLVVLFARRRARLAPVA